MNDYALAFEAEPEIITDIVTAAKDHQISISEPVPVKSPADALDSPIGAPEIQAGLEFVTIFLSAGTAFITFGDKLIDVVKKYKKKVIVRNPRDGQKLGELDQNSTSADVQKLISK